MNEKPNRKGWMFKIWVICLAAIAVLGCLGITSATIADDVTLDSQGFYITDLLGAEWKTFFANGQNIEPADNSAASQVMISFHDTGATSAADMLSRCYATISIQIAGGAVINTHTTNNTIYSPFYVGYGYNYWSLVDIYSFSFECDKEYIVTSTLYVVSGGVSTVDTVWTNYIDVGAALTYGDRILDGTFYHGDDYDNINDGGTFVMNGSSYNGYIELEAMHGNGTAPAPYANPIESYIKMVITDPNGTVVTTKMLYEKSAAEYADNTYLHVTYKGAEISYTYFNKVGHYKMTLQLYTQINDWTSFKLQDTWTMTINNLYAYTTEDQIGVGANGMAVAPIVVQGLVVGGVLMVPFGIVGGIYMFKRGKYVQGLTVIGFVCVSGIAIIGGMLLK